MACPQTMMRFCGDHGNGMMIGGDEDGKSQIVEEMYLLLARLTAFF